jgi:hypothetical protein
LKKLLSLIIGAFFGFSISNCALAIPTIRRARNPGNVMDGGALGDSMSDYLKIAGLNVDGNSYFYILRQNPIFHKICFGKDSTYSSSNVRNKAVCWHKGLRPECRLRRFCMTHNAETRCGGPESQDALQNSRSLDIISGGGCVLRRENTSSETLKAQSLPSMDDLYENEGDPFMCQLPFTGIDMFATDGICITGTLMGEESTAFIPSSHELNISCRPDTYTGEQNEVADSNYRELYRPNLVRMLTRTPSYSEGGIMTLSNKGFYGWGVADEGEAYAALWVYSRIEA